MNDATRRFGRYEILGLVGRGGMADVFLARAAGAEGVSKRLALKRILPMLASDPGFIDLFVVEAQIAVELTHANIVPVFDFGRIGSSFFLAMEYVEGRDLGALIAKARDQERPLAPPVAGHIGAEVARALDYAHRRHVVHRDVAPRNVLISAEGEVRLADFGVAHRGVEEQGQLRGTLTYMAPEQARGQQVDGRADLFALGMVLLETLTGQRPRESKDAAKALAAAQAAVVPPVPEGLPPALAAVVRRATAVDAHDRYPSARHMLEDLETYLRTEPMSARVLAEELSARFDGRAAAPIDPVPGDFADVLDELEVTYLGGELTTTVAGGTKGQRTRIWLAGGGLAAALAVALVLWSRETPRTEKPPIPAPVDVQRKDSKAKKAPEPVGTKSPAAVATKPEPDAASQTRNDEKMPIRRARTPAATGYGTVSLNAIPWATVYIDGKEVGPTPLVDHRLRAGQHRVRFENPDLGVPPKGILIELKPGEKFEQVVRLQD